jgi:catechol 2,3-dioxygenase-like lactoylglutathione lyase family enzyme
MKPRISMITLGVRDLAAAIDFYEKGLGFPITQRWSQPPGAHSVPLRGRRHESAVAQLLVVSPLEVSHE